MIKDVQKGLLHIYAHAAGLSDPAYRNVLREEAGCVSAADSDFRQNGFERAMARLEATLFDRVDRGLVSDPIGRSRWIRSRDYWRRRLPRRGFSTTRQSHRILDLWSRLAPALPEDARSFDYLGGIIRQAVGRRADAVSLSQSEAAAVIDALQDRLAHAAVGATRLEEVPF